MVVVMVVAAAFVLVVGMVGNYFPYQNVQIAFGAHDVSFSMDTVVLSPGVKGPGREVE
jgi:hypothetical protein